MMNNEIHHAAFTVIEGFGAWQIRSYVGRTHYTVTCNGAFISTARTLIAARAFFHVNPSTDKVTIERAQLFDHFNRDGKLVRISVPE